MIDRLRELLRAATPGEWHAHGCEITLGVTGHDVYQPDDPDSGFYCAAAGRIYDEGGHAEADAAYIAACDPDTIEELLDAHDRMAGAGEAVVRYHDAQQAAAVALSGLSKTKSIHIEIGKNEPPEWNAMLAANGYLDRAIEGLRAALAVPKEPG